jgi:hypothetical protein
MSEDINEDKYKVIPIRRNYDLRFAICDKETEFIVDDANGWGFKSKEAAEKVLSWKYKK